MQGVNLSRGGRRTTPGARLEAGVLPKELAQHVKRNALYDWLELIYFGTELKSLEMSDVAEVLLKRLSRKG